MTPGVVLRCIILVGAPQSSRNLVLERAVQRSVHRRASAVVCVWCGAAPPPLPGQGQRAPAPTLIAGSQRIQCLPPLRQYWVLTNMIPRISGDSPPCIGILCYFGDALIRRRIRLSRAQFISLSVDEWPRSTISHRFYRDLPDSKDLDGETHV